MNDSSLDKSCEGNMQGRFRLERGQFYYAYLQLYSNKKKIHQIEVVPDVAHDGDKMVNSKAARKFLFGNQILRSILTKQYVNELFPNRK